MIPRNKYLIEPLGEEYINERNGLVVNTSIEHAKYVNRIGVVISVPKEEDSIKEGDHVVVHHNVFRTYLDMKGRKRKSNEYFRDGLYLVSADRVYMYKRDGEWKAANDYCFVEPIEYIQESEIQKTDKEQEHTGVIRYSNKFLSGTKVGFVKDSEYEFNIDEQKLYRMQTEDVCLTITKKE